MNWCRMELMTVIYEIVRKGEYWPRTYYVVKQPVKTFLRVNIDLEHVNVEVDRGVKSGEKVG